MNDGLCPECGCELDVEEEEVWTGEYENVLLVQITYICPCCPYIDMNYED